MLSAHPFPATLSPFRGTGWKTAGSSKQFDILMLFGCAIGSGFFMASAFPDLGLERRIVEWRLIDN